MTSHKTDEAFATILPVFTSISISIARFSQVRERVDMVFFLGC
jgi:hypothetical protein